MKPYCDLGSAKLFCGDCRAVMPELPANSVDSIVTDPPYGIRFMGKTWDNPDILEKTANRAKYSTDPSERAGITGGHRSVAAEAGKYDRSSFANQKFQQWTREWATEAMRALKPGGHLLCFASTRTYHRMTCGIEDAGFEVRDQIGWVFGSGFPKSHNLHGDWEGWGTALKPAWEPICVARKPLVGTVAENVARYRTGAINIDECRVPGEPTPINRLEEWSGFGQVKQPEYTQEVNTLGRWPANIVHDGSDEVIAAFPNAPGQQGDLNSTRPRPSKGIFGDMAAPVPHKARRDGEESANRRYADSGSTNFAALPGDRREGCGSAARFFYAAKADREDRNEGCDHLPYRPGGMLSNTSGQHITRRDGGAPGPTKNNHPTVKPTDLMRWLCRLVTPTGGTILDPFAGSGSTGKAALYEGFDFIGIEGEEEYCAIAEARMRFVIETDSPLLRAAMA